LYQSDGYLLYSDASLQIGTGDFTVEFWYYHITIGGGAFPYLFSTNDAWGPGGLTLSPAHANFSNVGWTVYWDTGSDSYRFGSGTDLQENAWEHVAIVRQGTTLRLFVDGVMTNEVQSSVNYSFQNMFIGAPGWAPINDYMADGHIDDFRLVKGLAVYSGDFVPPSTALSANATAYTNYKPYGTFLFSECVDGDLTGTYANGTGGRYTEIISAGSCS
jgi:hypothetical protein